MKLANNVQKEKQEKEVETTLSNFVRAKNERYEKKMLAKIFDFRG